MMASSQHIVIPGQIIATSSANDEENSFLRGHGTYLENVNPDANHASYQNDNDPQNNISTHDHSSNHDSDKDDEDEFHNPHSHQNHHLIASCSGTITRTNKLIQITPPNAPYSPQTGDPIIGRITSVSSQRWNVSLNLTTNIGSLSASLPLTGIHMPDGMQRIRTNADALAMRTVLQEGDLISAEVRAVQSNTSSSSSSAVSSSNSVGKAGTPGVIGGGGGGASAIGNVILHARSVRCGKLQNGCFVMVPSWLIGRRKKQFVVLGLPDHVQNPSSTSSSSSRNKNQSKPGFDGVKIEVLLGCNGGIWIQRAMMELESSSSSNVGRAGGGEMMVQEKVQRIRKNHAKTEMTMEERIVLARVKNAIEALKLVYCKITPETIEAVVASAVQLGYENVVDMLRQDVIAKITACTRRREQQ